MNIRIIKIRSSPPPNTLNITWIKEGAGRGRRKKPHLHYITKLYAYLRNVNSGELPPERSMGAEKEPGKAMVLDIV
jgi:hypothetical protein